MHVICNAIICIAIQKIWGTYGYIYIYMHMCSQPPNIRYPSAPGVMCCTIHKGGTERYLIPMPQAEDGNSMTTYNRGPSPILGCLNIT